MNKVLFIAIGLLALLSTTALCGMASAESDDTLVISSVEYQDGVVYLSGTSTLDNIRAFVSYNGERVSSYAAYQVINGEYSGKLQIGEKIEVGTYVLTIFDPLTQVSQTKSFNVSSVTGVSLNTNSLELKVGNTSTLTATITPKNVRDSSITWTSSNPEVASISDSGLVMAHAVGTAVISVTSTEGGYVATCNVSVSQTTTSNVSITAEETSVTIYKGYTKSVLINLVGTSYDKVTVRSSDDRIVSVRSGSTLTATNEIVLEGITIGGPVTITVYSGDVGCKITVNVKEYVGTPCDTYYFFIKFEEGNTSGAKGISEDDARAGFWTVGTGSSAKEALQDVCRTNSWNLSFDETFFKGWLDTFLNLSTITNADGTYTYWSQYHWNGSAWEYNDYALGYLTTTDYQYLAMVYQTTSASHSGTINLGSNGNPANIPPELGGASDENVTITYNTNGGSAANFTETVKKGTAVDLSKTAGTKAGFKFLGWNTSSTAVTAMSSYTASSNATIYAVWVSESAKVETVTNPDGSVTTTVTDTVKNDDGTSTETVTATTEKENEDGSKVTTTEKTEEIKDKDGKTQSSLEEKTSETVLSDGSTQTQKETVVKDSEGKVTEEKTEVSIEDKSTGVTTSAEIKKDSEGKADVTTSTKVTVEKEITSDVIDEAIKQTEKVKKVAEEKEVEVKQIIEIETKGTEIEIPAASLSKLAEAETNTKLKTDAGTIEIPPEVAKKLSEESEEDKVTISISEADKDQLNDRQKEKVGESLVLDITAKSGNKIIHELGGTVTITVPYELEDGENPEKIAVWYLDDEGNITKRESTYNADTKTISFKTSTFSYYFIAQDVENTEPIEPKDDDNKNNNVIYYVLAAVIIIILVGAVLFMRHKGKL